MKSSEELLHGRSRIRFWSIREVSVDDIRIQIVPNGFERNVGFSVAINGALGY